MFITDFPLSNLHLIFLIFKKTPQIIDLRCACVHINDVYINDDLKCVFPYIHICVYIFTYREREREKVPLKAMKLLSTALVAPPIFDTFYFHLME